jgi:hypothetical protein
LISHVDKDDADGAGLKKVSIPFRDDGRNAHPALLVGLLWSILAVSLDLRPDLPGKLGGGRGQSQVRGKQIS